MRYRHLRRTFIAVLAALALAVAVVFSAAKALDSRLIRGFLAARLEAAAESVIGAEVTIGELWIDVVSGRLQLADVRFEGAPLSGGARHLTIEVRGLRLARRLVEIEAVHAAGVRLRVERAPAPSVGGRGLVRFVVRRLTLRDVSVEGRRLPGEVGLSLRGVEGGWDSRDVRPRGFVRAERFEVRVPGLRPLEGRLQARLRLDEDLAFPTLKLRAGQFRFDGSGGITSDGLRFRGRGRLSLSELDRVVRAGGVLAGSARYRLEIDTAADPFLSCTLTDGNVVAAGFPFGHVVGELFVSQEKLEARVDRATIEGGSVSGRYELRSMSAPFPHWLRARSSGVALEPILKRLNVPAVGLGARTDLTVEMAWNGSRIRRVRGSADATVRPQGGGVPASGRLMCSAAGESVLECRAEAVRVGHTTVHVEGPVDLTTGSPRWSVDGRTERLDELASFVNRWADATVLPELVGGVANVTGTLGGTWRRPRVTARVDGGPIRIGSLRLDRLTGVGHANGRSLTIDSCRVGLAGGAGSVVGGILLGTAGAPGKLSLRLSAADVSLGHLASSLGVPSGLEGTVACSGTLHGSVVRPVGSFGVGLVGLRVDRVDLGDGECRVELNDDGLSVKGLRLTAGVRGGGRWDVSDGRITAEATWEDASLEPLGSVATRLAGKTGRVHANVDWKIGHPPTVRVDALAPLAVAQLRLGPDGGTFMADLEDVGTGQIRLTRGSEGRLSGSGVWEIRQVAGLIERLLPERGLPVSGTATAAISMDFPPSGPPSIDGTVREAALTLDDRPVRLLSPLPFVIDDSGVRMEGARVAIGDEEVFLKLSVGQSGKLAGNLSGTFDALLLRLLVPQWRPAGRLRGIVELLGEVDAPRLDGIVEVRGGSFRLPGTDEVLRDINGTVLLGGRTADLEGFEFDFWSGASTASGQIRLVDRRPVLDVRGVAGGVSYELLPGLDLRLAGDWWLQGVGEDLELGGDLVVQRGVLAHRGDLADVLIDWFGDGEAASGGATPKLALHLEADRSVEARTAFAQLTASASLDIHGTPDRPGVVGQVELEEGGEFELRGVRYELERGLVTFNDPAGIEPRLDFQAKTWVDIYTVTVLVTGPPDHLAPTLYSDPPLDETDILSLLLLGTSEGGGEASAGGLLASNIVTSKINAVLERRAESILAVDQLRLDPFAESATGNPTARVTVVKQLSPKWTVILQSNVTSNREEVVLSRWYLRRGMFLEAMRDADGSYSLDLKYRRRY